MTALTTAISPPDRRVAVRKVAAHGNAPFIDRQRMHGVAGFALRRAGKVNGGPRRRIPVNMLGISALFIRTGTVGGAEYMLYNLVQGLSAHLPRHGATLFVRSRDSLDPAFQQKLGTVYAAAFSAVEIDGAANRFLLETTSVIRHARNGGVTSLLYPNYFTPPRAARVRTATVIHDLQHRHLPQNSSRRRRLWLSVAHRITLRFADAVIVPSHFVRDDVLNSYGHEHEAKVHAIPHPISWDRFAGAVDRSIIEHRWPYVLTVASHYDHKNLETLIRAFADVSRQCPEHRLVLVGQLRRNLQGVPSRSTAPLAQMIADLGLASRAIVKGHVSDETLGSLYAHADLFVLPSLFEGFGIPPVEALGMGIPTLTTRCAALPEVTLGKAQYVDDPRDGEELSNRIIDMITHRHAFVPSAEDTRAIRDHYCPARIASEYLQLLSGN